MSARSLILIPLFLLCLTLKTTGQEKFSFGFYGDDVAFTYVPKAHIGHDDSTRLAASVEAFLETAETTDFSSVLQALQQYRQSAQPDDWIYYQLIRKAAQAISPKADNYYQYTLYKCLMLAKSGYDVALTVVGPRLLFFVHTQDEVFDIPSFNRDGKRYVCLNFHDYGYDLGLDKQEAQNISLPVEEVQQAFSYKLTRLPRFRPDDYQEKNLHFSYHDIDYKFKVKLNNQIKQLFVNYPVTDYGLYLNSPLSQETYNTFIPMLRKHTRGMNAKQGIDYLMHFTRHAFSYEADHQHFGREKHLTPEQTLLYDRSDCEDRAALLYCLVKELYNIPMVILAFPNHVTVAVKLEKPMGKEIIYNGSTYSVCEPTPQAEDLPIGALLPELGSSSYEVAYSYEPAK